MSTRTGSFSSETRMPLRGSPGVATILHVVGRKYDEHHVLRRNVVALSSAKYEADDFGDSDAYIFRVPGVRHVGRADPEGEAAEHARHARVRVCADDELAGERDVLDDCVVADGLGAALFRAAVEAYALLLCETLLRRG